MKQVLEKLRNATKGSYYEGRLYLVGGIVRDKMLGSEPDEDIDIVLEDDAQEFAAFLYKSGVASSPPVTYPRFGTAMVSIDHRQVELVGARKESYDKWSRKPATEPGTLMDDVLRRDFTINTLLENLHTGEISDLTGRAREDLAAGIIRTPRDPKITFDDDPLRMLRAVRFATRFGFEIDPATYSAILEKAPRLGIVSAERIRAEFEKIIANGNASYGLEMLRLTGLLVQFAPELASMYGVTQNKYHIYDVWNHTLKTLESISADAGIILRLAALFHDVGKVPTRSVDDNGDVHFYRHEVIGAEITRRVMNKLHFSNARISAVTFIISMHLRVGEYSDQWSDSAVRRLLRDAGSHLEDLVRLTEADKAAANPEIELINLEAFRAHVERIRSELADQRMVSPLSGREIIDLLNIDQGPMVGTAKAYLENKIIDGELLPGDKEAAAALILRRFGGRRH